MRPRRAPQRTPSLVSDSVTSEFLAHGERIRGELRLDQPTQVLHFTFDATRLDGKDIVSINLHRAESGPVIASLGRNLRGSYAVPNAYLDDLMDNKLHIVIYTASGGELRGTIKRR